MEGNFHPCAMDLIVAKLLFSKEWYGNRSHSMNPLFKLRVSENSTDKWYEEFNLHQQPYTTVTPPLSLPRPCEPPQWQEEHSIKYQKNSRNLSIVRTAVLNTYNSKKSYRFWAWRFWAWRAEKQ